MIETDRFEKVEVTSPQALWDWLEAHHAQESSVWLVTFKKGAPGYVSRDEVLDALMAYGWIDGIRRKLDDTRTMQLISPRKQQAWAQSYKDRVESLRAEGRMRPPGEAAVERGKVSGLWTASAQVDRLEIPDDLAQVFAATPPAADNWEAFAPSYRRNVLRWIAAAKRPETRAKRLAATATASAENRKLPQM